MNMVLGRAGGYALLGSVPLVLVWLIMCRLVPTLLIITQLSRHEILMLLALISSSRPRRTI
jgi:hypothetical protein